MGVAAANAAGAPAGLPPVGLPAPGAPPAPAAPQAGGLPAPEAPAAPPYMVRMQPDGSSIYVIPSPDGDLIKDIVLGVNPAPKLKTPAAK